MAQADLLVNLVKSASSGDQPAIRKAAEASIEVTGPDFQLQL